MSHSLPNSKILNELLSYDPETGKLFWKHRDSSFFEDGKYSSERRANRWNSTYVGKEAFTFKNHDGYLRGSIFKNLIMAHRVIWCMYYGIWPVGQIDHVNGIPWDNRIVNLREATQSENVRNTKSRKGSFSKYLGVTFHKKSEKYRAKIQCDKKQYFLGSFDDEIDAAKAYDQAATEKFGKFANLNFGGVSK